ncbi:MAG: C-GCAxxG-C-C family protein [Anaerolineae bacterium]
MLAVGGHVLEDFRPTYVRMMTGLAGGVGNTKEELCGALSSGVVILSALYGRAGPEESDEPAYRWSALYRERFREALGTTHCQTLRDQVGARPGYREPCAQVVERATTVLLGVLEEARRSSEGGTCG